MKLGLKNVKVGFTGTQRGMTQQQKEKFFEVIEALFPDEFHHGDCIGADEDAHYICCVFHYSIIIHPPTVATKRAFCRHEGEGSYVVLPPKDYMARNQDIVDAVEVLVATPKGYAEELRSGTWATVRRAVKANRIVFVIWPNGKFQRIEPKNMKGRADLINLG